MDLGVRNAQAVPMTRVASAPTTGQYAVTNGVYTFAAADTGRQVFISYQYTTTQAGARSSNVQNLLMGNAPTFRCSLSQPFQGQVVTLVLPNCVSSKLGLSTKLDDFQVPEFEFDAFADAAGNVMTYSISE